MITGILGRASGSRTMLEVVARRWRAVVRRGRAFSWRQCLLDQFMQSVVHPCPGIRFERLGSEYGGWAVPVDLIKREWICYCGGVGEDSPISALMRELGHSRIDLLKLDIEGAQHEVLRSMLRDGIRPTVVCVEFDQPDTVVRMYRTYRRLRKAGYRLVVRDGWNLTFLRYQ